MAGIEVEVIEFTRPFESNKNVYMTRLPSSLTEVELLEYLEAQFGIYGLVYDIKLFPGSELMSNSSFTGEKCDNDQATGYGFVTFYSSLAAKKAVQDLSGGLFLKGSLIKVQLAKKKASLPPQALYISKCYELAFHYLGFNGYSIAIDKVYIVIEDPGIVSLITQVTLTLPKHDLDTYGLGKAEEKYNPDDVGAKAAAYCKARKNSYSAAVVSAFSKVVLVITGTGKLHVEINTTAEDLLNREMNMEPLLQVNELEESPGEESDDEAASENKVHMQDTQDEININILAELES